MIEQLLEADRQLQVDQVDRARQIYGRVVEADPSNAMAVVGLARCALADEHDREAYDLARQALRIDPENDMARRMSARLAEVLASRGELVEETASSPPAGPGPRSERGSGAPTLVASPPVSQPRQTATGPAGKPGRSLLDRLLGR